MRLITKEDIFEMVHKSSLDLNVNIETIDPDMEFMQQGLDSLDLANLLFAIESEFEVDLSDVLAGDSEWKTLNSLVDIINKLLQEKMGINK